MIGETQIAGQRVVFNNKALSYICEQLDCLPEEVITRKPTYKHTLDMLKGGLIGAGSDIDVNTLIDNAGGYNSIPWTDMLDVFAKSVYNEQVYEMAKVFQSEETPKKKLRGSKSKRTQSVA